MSTLLQALIWDVDGTLAETECEGHRVAFNQAFAACGLPWHWSDAHYAQLLKLNSGRERLLGDMAQRSDAPALAYDREALAQRIQTHASQLYIQLARSGAIALRPGVSALIAQCQDRGVRMAIATTAQHAHVEALLSCHLGPHWATYFEAIITGENVAHRKPDPEVYLQVLAQLNIDPLRCVALEDSPTGVAAACAADIPVIVTQSNYFKHTTIEGAIAIGPSLGRRDGWRPGLVSGSEGPDTPVTLDDIQGWCTVMDTVSQFA